MSNKIKCFLISMLFFIFVAPVFSYNRYVLSDTCYLEQADNFARLNYIETNTILYLEFDTETQAYDFLMDVANLYATLKSVKTNSNKIKYPLSTILIERIKYIISYAPTGSVFEPEGVKQKEYNKLYYMEDKTTERNNSLKVDKNINEILNSIIKDGVFNDKLLNKYDIPLPTDTDERDLVGYGLTITVRRK